LTDEEQQEEELKDKEDGSGSCKPWRGIKTNSLAAHFGVFYL